jgi:hypothetical protein
VARPAGSHCADPDAREPRRRADARRSGCACGGAGLSWPLPAAVIPLVHDGARLAACSVGWWLMAGAGLF